MNTNGTRELVEAALKVYAPVTAPQLAEHMGLTQQGVWWHLKSLHDGTPKRAYVVDYRRQTTRGRDVYVWAAGDREDAKHPPKRRGPVDRKQIDVLAVADPDEELERQEESRVSQAEERQRQKMLAEIKPFRDPLIWALFGDGLSTNTLGEQGYGELRALSPRPEGFVKERNKAQTEGIRCQELAVR